MKKLVLSIIVTTKLNTKILLLCLLFTTSLYAFADENYEEINCQEQDYIALRALYLSTDGDNWTDNTGWLTAAEFMANSTMPAGTDVDTWYGITTNSDGCVICIDMDGEDLCSTAVAAGNNNLVGSIPPEIGHLVHLEKLFLSRNQLSGNIPPEIGNLNNLVWLYLAGCQLNGSIPAEIGNLSNLERLYLGINQLSGSIPPEIGNLNNLVWLFLQRNQLSGNIPVEMSNMSNLLWMYLEDNQLSGNIPVEITNLNNLERLVLTRNQLSGNIPPELSNLSNLKQLVISDNEFTGSIPPELGNLSNLQYLSLSVNELTGSIPVELGNLDNLGTLNLFNNQLGGCYDAGLTLLCENLPPFTNTNQRISNGNNFDADWEDFCNTSAGICPFLPVEQPEAIQARIKNKTTILTWKTATETNNKGFEIQRSDNGVRWESIAWQSGQGNSLTQHSYTYTDNKPLTGTNYYRLKQIDFDGNFNYSDIVSVHHKVTRITVYPNPVENILHISNSNNSLIQQVIMYDQVGKAVIKTNPIQPRIDVSGLHKGIYIIEVITENGILREKVVVR